MIVKPHTLMMVSYFFMNAFPVYTMDSVDKPYWYHERPDEHNRSEMHIKVKDLLVCFQNRHNHKKTIYCQTGLYLDTLYESIKDKLQG